VYYGGDLVSGGTKGSPERQCPMAKLTRVAPELPATDLQASTTYYEQQLGFNLAMHLPDHGYAIVERDDIAIHLFEDSARTHSPIGIHIFTPDLDSLFAELKQRGAHLSQDIMQKPWGNRDFRVTDSSGNEIKFTEPLSSDE
jgi:predicted enzyme related to lactoylglutathione lyase